MISSMVCSSKSIWIYTYIDTRHISTLNLSHGFYELVKTTFCILSFPCLSFSKSISTAQLYLQITNPFSYCNGHIKYKGERESKQPVLFKSKFKKITNCLSLFFRLSSITLLFYDITILCPFYNSWTFVHYFFLIFILKKYSLP